MQANRFPTPLLAMLWLAAIAGCAVGEEVVNPNLLDGSPIDRTLASTDIQTITASDAAMDGMIDDATEDGAMEEADGEAGDSGADAVSDIIAIMGCATMPGAICTPGTMQACGNCGTQNCQLNCQWSACVGSLACSPGATHTEPCGNCGTQMYQCSAGCADEAVGSCAGQGGCTPGSTMTQPCGNCGTQNYTCSAACNFEATGDCTDQGACTPGATHTESCGNCGHMTYTCSSSCVDVAGGCTGSGACSPGSTQGGGCDPCSEEVCSSSCAWGGCTLRPGNACEYEAGTHHRACSACECGYQFCLNSCQWSTACVSCCSTCGGCL